MSLSIGGVVRDAWAMFRRDRDLLLRVIGLFVFLPAFAVELLVAPPPAMPAGALTDAAQLQPYLDWAQANGGWYLLYYAANLFGVLTVLTLKLDRTRPDIAGALRLALMLLFRYLLASVLIAFVSGAGLLLFVIPALWVIGRTMPVGPVIVAERPTGAIAAIVRAVRLTAGANLALIALAALTVFGGWLGSIPFETLDQALRQGAGGGNPVALAIVDAGSAAVATAVALATGLLQVAVYRRLAR